MAAPKKKLFKNTPTPGNEKQDSINDLKDQLTSIQSKIANIEGEGKEEQQKQPPQREVETLFKWESASHVYIPRGKKWLTYIILTTLLIILVILFFREFFIIAPVLAIAFVAYVLASVPPNKIEHLITTEGLISGKHDYLWQELYDFWFAEKHSHTLLTIDTQLGYPGRIILIIDKNDKEKVKNLLLNYLPFREIPRTNWLDSLGDSLSNIFHKIAS